MATKKQSVLNEEMKGKDLMSILSYGDGENIFHKNDMVDFSYKTGISVIDYAFGYETNIYDGDQFIGKKTVLGLQAGSFVVITGATQSFKTTLGIQMAANIAYANDGNIYHYDAENRLVLQRAKALSKLPNSWFEGEHPRYALRSGAIGYDTLQNDVTEIYKNKMQYKDILLKDTGEVDHNNNPIMMMPPTVIFLDSLSDVINKEYDLNNKKAVDDLSELRSNTYGMQNARTLRGVLTDILPMLKEANILFICIAHQNQNVSMNAFAGPKKQFSYGSADEKISGGKVVEYSASAVLKFSGEISADSRYHIDTDNFEGNTVVFEPIKSSTNESGNVKTGWGFRIVVDKRKEGADNLRTLILFLNQKGRLKGNKAGFKVVSTKGEELSDKFTWKNVYKEFKDNPNTYKVFMQAAKEELDAIISKTDHESIGTIDPFDVNKVLASL